MLEIPKSVARRKQKGRERADAGDQPPTQVTTQSADVFGGLAVLHSCIIDLLSAALHSCIIDLLSPSANSRIIVHGQMSNAHHCTYNCSVLSRVMMSGSMLRVGAHLSVL